MSGTAAAGVEITHAVLTCRSDLAALNVACSTGLLPARLYDIRRQSMPVSSGGVLHCQLGQTRSCTCGWSLYNVHPGRASDIAAFSVMSPLHDSYTR